MEFILVGIVLDEKVQSVVRLFRGISRIIYRKKVFIKKVSGLSKGSLL